MSFDLFTVIGYVLTVIEYIVFDVVIVIIQSFIPGSNESIWDSSHYLWLFLLIITISIYRILIKMGYAK